jgi:hypothetical protein
MTAGLKTIIALSFVRRPRTLRSIYVPSRPYPANYHQVLAVGFLLVILSCALYHRYHPLLVVATYVIAPLPNWICSRCANPDDFGAEGAGNAILDFGKFVTGGLVVMGIGEFYMFLILRGSGRGAVRRGRKYWSCGGMMDYESNI